jgi:hypothetical protein
VTAISGKEGYRLVAVAPVYDDAASAAQLLERLQSAFVGTDVALRVMFVDDGSPAPLAQQLKPPGGIQADVLRLKRNVGHQRAIALGIAYLQEQVPCEAMLVMDADGEDRPEDAVALVARCRALPEDNIVFAERTRRSESTVFQFFYRLYQLIHWMLTGIQVRVGNFSVVPASRLAALVTMPALWNHYAAAIFQGRLPRQLVPTVRGSRYSGRSKMNFVSLVIHGLQAISVFVEVVAVRLLLIVCLFACGCGALFALALASSLFEPLAAPAWVSCICAGLLIVALCLALGCFTLTLGLLAQRNNLDFIPARDYRLFVEGLHHLPVMGDALGATPQRWGERAAIPVHSESELRP